MVTKEKIDALMQDEAFVEKFKAAGSPEEIIALYKEQGIDITPENAKASYDYMHKSGELDEEALENVSGGSAIGIIGIATAAAAASIAVGFYAAGEAAWNINRIAGNAAVDVANTILSDTGVPKRYI